MEWTPEKLCSAKDNYELLIERFKHGYHCHQSAETWKWRVISSGVVMAQGISNDMLGAQKMAEANIPLNS